MTEITWAEPPATKRVGRARRTFVDRIADELKANPGRWALVAEDAWPHTRKQWKDRGLEVVGRRTRPGKAQENLYARYNPDHAA
jgi:hypothetical protein